VLLNILIYVQKKKLDLLILLEVDYSKILKQSQKLDVLIVKKFKLINKPLQLEDAKVHITD